MMRLIIILLFLNIFYCQSIAQLQLNPNIYIQEYNGTEIAILEIKYVNTSESDDYYLCLDNWRYYQFDENRKSGAGGFDPFFYMYNYVSFSKKSFRLYNRFFKQPDFESSFGGKIFHGSVKKILPKEIFVVHVKLTDTATIRLFKQGSRDIYFNYLYAYAEGDELNKKQVELISSILFDKQILKIEIPLHDNVSYEDPYKLKEHNKEDKYVPIKEIEKKFKGQEFSYYFSLPIYKICKDNNF